MMNGEKVGLLGAEALKRRERIELWKKRNDVRNKSEDEPAEKLPKPKFRSYKPQDDNLKENVLNDPKPGDVEAEVQDLLCAAKSKVIVEELDIGSLAPRKSDWDLKRDVARKAEKLERKTQKTIAELIIQRLKQTNSHDLITALNMIGDTD